MPEVLRSEVQREAQKRPLRRSGARAAPTVREELLPGQAPVAQQAVEQPVRRFGWRVYGTTQEARALPLEKAVYAYREQYGVEQWFGRRKGGPVSLTPVYWHFAPRVGGLLLRLTLAGRVLGLAQCGARRTLKEQGQKLSGLYAGQPGRPTARPTTEMRLRAFPHLPRSCFSVKGETQWHLPPLSPTQTRILKLLGISSSAFSKLVPTIPKTEWQAREP
jgi:hypothetical protein